MLEVEPAMGAFYVFLSCANGTKLYKVLQLLFFVEKKNWKAKSNLKLQAKIYLKDSIMRYNIIIL